MSVEVGVGLAFVAMLCWGIGDFLIQRSTRTVGDWETILFIDGFGILVLLPFVYKDLPKLFDSPQTLLVLSVSSVVLLLAALLELESLKIGKLAVIEPTWSLEIPVAVFLALAILDEKLSFLQLVLIVALIVGLFLVSFRNKIISRRFFLEKGVFLSIVAATVMGAANFFVGWGARLSDALMVNFFTSIVLFLAATIYLLYKGKLRTIGSDLYKNRTLILPMAILDNAAWVAFAFAMTLAPIGITVALSESYIIIAVILGLAVNRERLITHQKFGLLLALSAAIALAAMTA